MHCSSTELWFYWTGYCRFSRSIKLSISIAMGEGAAFMQLIVHVNFMLDYGLPD